MTTPSRELGITQFVPGTPEHAVLVNNVEMLANRVGSKFPGAQALTRFYYDTLADSYNALPIRGLVRITPPNPVHNTNIVTLLKHRGLVPGVDVQVVVPSTDSDGAHLPRAIRPRFLLKMSDAPMRKVLKGPSAERKEDLEKCLLAAVAARQMKLVTILDQIPQLKAQTPETKQKVDEWLLGDHLSESPIEALIEDLKNGEQDSMKAELEALRKQAQQEAQGLVALGVLRSKLNEQVGGEVVFLGQSLAK